MKNGLFNGMYVMNIVFQSVFTLLCPPALLFFLDYLLVNKCGFPEWTYAIAITVGILSGLVSMIRFVLRATSALERLEDEQKKVLREKANKKGNGK